MGKLFKFITEGAAIGGIRNYVWLIVAAVIGAIAFTIITIADNRDKRMIDTAQNAGAVTAIVAGHETTLHQSEKANEAGNQVRNDRGNARYAACLRSATGATRANCNRFRNEPVPD